MKEHLAFAVLMVGIIVAVARCTVACAGSLSAKDGQHFSNLADKLAGCRQEAYAAREAGATPVSADMKYEDCKRREGIVGSGSDQ